MLNSNSFLRACAGALALLLTSCGHSPTRVEPTRTVSVILADSLGQPLSGARVVAITERHWSETLVADTDTQGLATFQLPAGATIIEVLRGGFSSLPPGRSAGITLEIPPPANGDTTLIRLVHHTSARIQGRVLLAGASNHRQTAVYRVGDMRLISAGTDSLGNYTLEEVPLGNWRIRFLHDGWKEIEETVLVTAPGAITIAPDVVLQH